MPEIRVDLSKQEGLTTKFNRQFPQTDPDFVTKTAANMPLSEKALASVFPHRNCFLDVVHLTALGHAIVADQVLSALQEHLEE